MQALDYVETFENRINCGLTTSYHRGGQRGEQMTGKMPVLLPDWP
jgi:hypothetical protein